MTICVSVDAPVARGTKDEHKLVLQDMCHDAVPHRLVESSKSRELDVVQTLSVTQGYARSRTELFVPVSRRIRCRRNCAKGVTQAGLSHSFCQR